MRKPIIAGNWKMNKTTTEAVRLAKQLKVLLPQNATDNVEVVVCPPFTSLYSVGEVLKGSGIALGSQDVAWADEGAYTGEVSPGMLKDVGCRYTIVGHSERRTYFQESDTDVRRKIDAALARGLSVIVCVGESEDEREQNRTEEVVARQVKAAVSGLDIEDPERLVIAYEPIWAIGTGKTATSEEAGRVCGVVRGLIAEGLGDDMAAAVRIQYGGSVNPDNIASLMAQEHIDGALVGGASLDASSFSEIVKG